MSGAPYLHFIGILFFYMVQIELGTKLMQSGTAGVRYKKSWGQNSHNLDQQGLDTNRAVDKINIIWTSRG